MNPQHGFEFLRHGLEILEDNVELFSKDREFVDDLQTKIALLPHRGQNRCHEPGFGLELSFPRGTWVRMTFCFQCNNIFYRAPYISHIVEFEAKSEQGQELLEFLREHSARKD